ncbi:hypothetical protein CF336_g4819 [Tilletia laevis]|nr:hypothetical protein CF336_g4819 [Tilletia laevis]
MRAAIAAGGAPTDVAAAAEATIAALNPPEAWALHFETARQHKERMKEDPAGQGEADWRLEPGDVLRRVQES